VSNDYIYIAYIANIFTKHTYVCAYMCMPVHMLHAAPACVHGIKIMMLK